MKAIYVHYKMNSLTQQILYVQIGSVFLFFLCSVYLVDRVAVECFYFHLELVLNILGDSEFSSQF